jgi:anti-sigma factor RsiW
MNEKYTLEELEAYLLGELSPDRKEELDEKIKTDKELKEELEALKISQEAIELAGWKSVISKTQKEFLAEREEDNVRPLQSGTKTTGFWLGRIAASLALILVGSIAVLFFSTSPESITSKQLDYSIPVLRSSENKLEEIEIAYQSGDFDQVLALSTDITTYDAEAYFLIGLAYLELENGAKAAEYLTTIESDNHQNSTNNYADPVDYYLVKAYLIQSNTDLAEARMVKILEDSDHTYHNNFNRFDLLKVKILKIK